jgi:hypothetical protein
MFTAVGDGTGRFTAMPPVPSAVDANPGILADMNGDGIPDLVAIGAERSSVLTWLGNGDGTFGENRR